MTEFIASARPDEMVNQEPAAVAARAGARCPRACRAWALWAVLGLVGAHLLYLRRPREAATRVAASVAGACVAWRWVRARPFAAAVLVAVWLADGVRLRRLLAAERARAEREAMREVEAERDEAWRV